MNQYLLTAFFIFTTFSLSFASNYRINEEKLEAHFASSIDVSSEYGIKAFISTNLSHVESNLSEGGMNKHTTAAIVAYVEMVLGVGILIPIHRLILGCGGSELKVVALYCVTLGGCGLLPLVDGIFLIMDLEGDQYVDNPKFLMWSGSN
jgi:hypothetical protein